MREWGIEASMRVIDWNCQLCVGMRLWGQQLLPSHWDTIGDKCGFVIGICVIHCLAIRLDQ